MTPHRVQVLQGKLKTGVDIITDEQGKHSNHPRAIKTDVKDKIREHIQNLL